MSEIIETVQNITKDGDVYTYELVHTKPIRISIEKLNADKQELEKKIAIIDYILTEIGKL